MSSQQLVDFIHGQLKTVSFLWLPWFILQIENNFEYIIQIVVSAKSGSNIYIKSLLCRRINYLWFVRKCLIGAWHQQLVVRDVIT